MKRYAHILGLLSIATVLSLFTYNPAEAGYPGYARRSAGYHQYYNNRGNYFPPTRVPPRARYVPPPRPQIEFWFWGGPGVGVRYAPNRPYYQPHHRH